MNSVFWREVDKGLASRGQRRPWLAAKSGISLGRINNWYIRGTLPRVDDAVKISDALQVPVRQLVTGEEKLSQNNIPDELRDLIHTYLELPSTQRAQALTICHATMMLIDQGVLNIPLSAYFRSREGASKLSGSPALSGRGRDAHTSS